MRTFGFCLGLYAAASSAGCIGAYVEGQASYYPTIKYKDGGDTAPPLSAASRSA